MKHKTTRVFTLLFISTIAALSQTPSVTLNSQPSRAVGQPQLFPEAGAPNRVEGREFWSPQSVALDTSGATAAVYVSDLANNRVLAWKNATGFSNGQTADMVIGQQDLFSTSPQGPGGSYPTGLFSPTGLVVDSKGNLYVADSGNNRILRYPKPFSQQGQIIPDLWLGQPSITGRSPNYTGQVTGGSLVLSSSSSLFQSSLAFDASGNLWASDPGNARVLRFPAANLQVTNSTAQADIVLGQSNLTSSQPTALGNNLTSFQAKNQFGLVNGLGFDAKGRLYVCDAIGNQGRVLVYSNPSSQNGNLSADRIMGVIVPSQLGSFQGQDPSVLSVFQGQTLLSDPGAVFILPDSTVGVVDSALNRILIFPPYEQWPAESTYFSPQATAVVGQKDFLLTDVNPNQFVTGGSYVTPVPSASTLANPTSAVFLSATKELFVCDSGNNRMIVLPQSGTTFGGATRVLGQDRMNQFAMNLVEGKEFSFYAAGAYAETSMAFDTTGPVPHLWVSDPHNNRVLGFKDARTLTPATVPDIVLGQPDKSTTLCNYSPNPTTAGSLNNPSQNSLCLPYGVTVDSKGAVYVADSGNGRVLRFPNPWASGADFQSADLVLGQTSFNFSIIQTTQSYMSQPYGLAISGKSGLLVSDIHDNRVLYFPFSANGDFTAGADNGKAASKVFGQGGSFTAVAKPAGSGLASFNSPRNIATDTNGQFYVADAGNNRVLIFGDPNNAQTSNTSILQLNGLNSPHGIYVNSGTGEIWVTNTQSGTLVRYPKYDTLQNNGTATATIQDVVNNTLLATLAVAQDQNGDLFVADSYNRIAVYYQGFTAVNAATSLARPLAPAMMATLYPLASATQFGANTATESGTTWPTSLGDIQVTFAGTPAPLYFVSPGQINFFVPQSAPAGSNVEIEVVQVSTGQVLGAQQVPINTIAPGIYTTCQANQAGTQREACVLNEDFTVNSASNPAPRGSVIQIFGTGQGMVTNPPADGSAAVSSPLSGTVASPTRVAMGTCFIDDCGTPLPGDVGTAGSHSTSWVSFSGLTPGLVGLWQVNAQIPMAIPPASSANNGGQTTVFIQLNGVASGGLGPAGTGFNTYFYVGK